MKILFLCPHFEPDTAPTGIIATQLVQQLTARGHEVQVVTSLPWYRKHKIEPAWRRKLITTQDCITRVYPFPSSKRFIFLRAFGQACFALLTLFAATTSRRKPGCGPECVPVCVPECVIAMSPPITLGFAGWFTARRWRVPFVLNLQDIFPDVAIDVDVLRNPRLITFAQRLEKFLYSKASAITVLSEEMATNIKTKSPDSLVHVISNFADIASITPQDRNTPYRATHNLADKTVVMYAGNVGYSQPLEIMLNAAKQLTQDDLIFVINGEGSQLQSLKDAANDLPNLLFVDYQPPEDLPQVLASADIHVIALGKGLAKSSVPSKLYSILAAARPVLASVDVNSEIVKVIQAANAGLVVPPEDADAFIAAVQQLLDDPDLRTTQGTNGRSYVETLTTPAEAAEAYDFLLSELIANPKLN